MMRKSLNSVASWQSGGGGGQRGAKGVGCYRAAAIRGGEHSVVVKGGSRPPLPLSLSLAPRACFPSVREGVEITGAERANHICRHLL